MDDPYDLARFVRAQQDDYERALSEITRGQKRTHWMWYVFPQFAGLGLSAPSRKYSIASLAEAEAYLRHEVLGPRLVACAEAALGCGGTVVDERLVLQGDQRKRLPALLPARGVKKVTIG